MNEMVMISRTENLRILTTFFIFESLNVAIQVFGKYLHARDAIGDRCQNS